jgi:hypothetical protein
LRPSHPSSYLSALIHSLFLTLLKVQEQERELEKEKEKEKEIEIQEDDSHRRSATVWQLRDLQKPNLFAVKAFYLLSKFSVSIVKNITLPFPSTLSLSYNHSPLAFGDDSRKLKGVYSVLVWAPPTNPISWDVDWEEISRKEEEARIKEKEEKKNEQQVLEEKMEKEEKEKEKEEEEKKKKEEEEKKEKEKDKDKDKEKEEEKTEEQLKLEAERKEQAKKTEEEWLEEALKRAEVTKEPLKIVVLNLHESEAVSPDSLPPCPPFICLDSLLHSPSSPSPSPSPFACPFHFHFPRPSHLFPPSSPLISPQVRYAIHHNLFPELNITLCTPGGELLTNCPDFAADREKEERHLQLIKAQKFGKFSSRIVCERQFLRQDIKDLLELIRFFNSEYNYSSRQAISILTHLSVVDTKTRLTFFESLLPCRPHHRFREWSSLSISMLFEYVDHTELEQYQKIMTSATEQIRKKFTEVEAVLDFFKSFVEDESKFLSFTNLGRALVALLDDQADLQVDLTRLLKGTSGGKEFINYVEYVSRILSEGELDLESRDERTTIPVLRKRRHVVRHLIGFGADEDVAKKDKESLEEEANKEGSEKEKKVIFTNMIHPQLKVTDAAKLGQLCIATGHTLFVEAASLVSSRLFAEKSKQEGEEWTSVIPRWTNCSSGKWQFEVRIYHDAEVTSFFFLRQNI